MVLNLTSVSNTDGQANSSDRRIQVSNRSIFGVRVACIFYTIVYTTAFYITVFRGMLRVRVSIRVMVRVRVRVSRIRIRVRVMVTVKVRGSFRFRVRHKLWYKTYTHAG